MRRDSQIFHRMQAHATHVRIHVGAHFPSGRPGRDGETQKQFGTLWHWTYCSIAWTMTPPASRKDGRHWKSIDHFSLLPYGWIPDDGADFLLQFILYMKERWLALGTLAEAHLGQRVC